MVTPLFRRRERKGEKDIKTLQDNASNDEGWKLRWWCCYDGRTMHGSIWPKPPQILEKITVARRAWLRVKKEDERWNGNDLPQRSYSSKGSTTPPYKCCCCPTSPMCCWVCICWCWNCCWVCFSLHLVKMEAMPAGSRTTFEPSHLALAVNSLQSSLISTS